ncbi:hypothetical protein MRX96_045854 [Rhipicephalus microplus]
MLTSTTQCSGACQPHASFPIRRRALRCYEGDEAAGRLSGGIVGRGCHADRRGGNALDGGSSTLASPATPLSSHVLPCPFACCAAGSFHHQLFYLRFLSGHVLRYLTYF